MKTLYTRKASPTARQSCFAVDAVLWLKRGPITSKTWSKTRQQRNVAQQTASPWFSKGVDTVGTRDTESIWSFWICSEHREMSRASTQFQEVNIATLRAECDSLSPGLNKWNMVVKIWNQRQLNLRPFWRVCQGPFSHCNLKLKHSKGKEKASNAWQMKSLLMVLHLPQQPPCFLDT